MQDDELGDTGQKVSRTTLQKIEDFELSNKSVC